MNHCRRCGTQVPPRHGFCQPCAVYVDAFDIGANFVDDFEGMTDAEADDYAVMMIEDGESWAQYVEAMEPSVPAPGDRKLFISGLIAGLKAHARENARIQQEREEEGW